jgi:DNA-binding transcriptional LysR family regulator
MPFQRKPAMTSLRRSISSIPSLATFEAAARLGSFTLAARELGVTQAAVSRQIRLLESDLNRQLFQRSHRHVELTRAGQVLAASVTMGFDRITETIEELREDRLAGTVTLGATLAFSHFWLLPRLTSFRRTHPDVKMRLISQNNPFDFRRDGVQIAIRYGHPPFPGTRVVASFSDRISPVCSPAFRDQVGPITDDREIFNLPLITVDWADPTWTTWGSWTEGAGFGRQELRYALRFSHYTDAIYAAMSGEGVALAWERLLHRQISEGQLVRLGSASMDPEDGYHAVIAEGADLDEDAQQIINWIAEEFALSAQSS